MKRLERNEKILRGLKRMRKSFYLSLRKTQEESMKLILMIISWPRALLLYALLPLLAKTVSPLDQLSLAKGNVMVSGRLRSVLRNPAERTDDAKLITNHDQLSATTHKEGRNHVQEQNMDFRLKYLRAAIHKKRKQDDNKRRKRQKIADEWRTNLSTSNQLEGSIEKSISSRQPESRYKLSPGSSSLREVKFEVSDDLLQLLAEFYAHSQITKLRFESQLAKLLPASSLQKNDTDTMRLSASPGKQEMSGSFNDRYTSIESLSKRFGADDASLSRWLLQRQADYKSLKNLTLELLFEAPTRRINVCLDGPKIWILPDVSDILYCYTPEQWNEKLWSDLRISPFYYTIFISLNTLIFLFGSLGNIFVCLSVHRNHRLRNVTNYFIVNLAFADLLVILICLPATAVWDLTLTWFFGTYSCKLIMYLQDVSVSVSVMTLTAISLDRYYAICYPLKFKSNLNVAKQVIAVIWVVSMLIMAPDLIYLSAKESDELKEAGLETVLYSDCNYDWSEQSSRYFQFIKTVILYLAPLILMLCAHFKIMKTLQVASSICDQELMTFDSKGSSNQTCQLEAGNDTEPVQRCHIRFTEDLAEGSKLLDGTSGLLRTGNGSVQSSVRLTVHNKSKLESRRKVVTMLSAIVIIFGVCYLPVHLIQFLRLFLRDLPQNDITSTLSMLSHCACYLNSAINPIIYNYMNSVFRAEFRKFLSCWPQKHESTGGSIHVAGSKMSAQRDTSLNSGHPSCRLNQVSSRTAAGFGASQSIQTELINNHDCGIALKKTGIYSNSRREEERDLESESGCLSTVILSEPAASCAITAI